MGTITKDDLNYVDFRREREPQLAYKKHFKKLAALKKPYAMSWSELHSARTTITDEMESFLDLMQKEKREFTLSEDMGYRTAEDMLEWIAEEFDRRNKANTKEPIPGNKFEGAGHVIYNPDGTREYLGTGITTSYPEGFETSNLRNMLKPDKVNYRSIFHPGEANPQLDSGGFRSFAEFCRALISGRYDERLEQRASATFAEITGEGGGFAVPSQFIAEIFSIALEETVLLKNVRIIPMTSREMLYPAWDMSTFSGPSLAGFTATWTAEGSGSTPQVGKLRNMELKNHKVSVYTNLSREVAADSPMLEAEVGKLLVNVVAQQIEYELINGSGIARPLGVINCPSTIKVSRTGAGAIAYTDVINMYKRLHKAYARGALWLANYDAVGDLLGMTVNNFPVWPAATYSGIAGELSGKLLGIPIHFTSHNPGLGSEGDLILLNPREYVCGLRENISVERSNSPEWENDLLSMRAIARAAGQSLWNSAITPAQGANSLSWAVCLK